MHKKTKLFLCFQVLADEFSHTVLHRQPFVVPVQKAVQGKPVKPAAGKLQYIYRNSCQFIPSWRLVVYNSGSRVLL